MYFQTARVCLIDQLHCHLKPLFSDHLLGFRKGHSCQILLTNFVESVRKNLTVNFVSVHFSQTCPRLLTASRVACLSASYLAMVDTGTPASYY